MNVWIFVPCGFGLWWLASGLDALGLLSGSAWVALIVGALAVAACGVGRRRHGGIVEPKTFRVSVLAESVGIAIVLLSCSVAGRSDLVMPMIGIVVGLHFVPLARAFGDRRFILSGCALAGVCLCSLFWRPPLRMAIAGLGAGAVLWTFAVWTRLRERREGERARLALSSAGGRGASR